MHANPMRRNANVFGCSFACLSHADSHSLSEAFKMNVKRQSLAGGRTVVVQFDERNVDFSDEILELLHTAGVKVEARITQRNHRPDPATLIGKGKVDEVKEAARSEKASFVVFDNQLSPIQVRNLEDAIECPVVDRVEVILEIFAMHARTAMAKAQIELARLKYAMPRIIRRVVDLEQLQAGAPVRGAVGMGARGPGEKKIEYDRRALRRSVKALEDSIHDIQNRKNDEVMRRSRRFFTAAVAGYTNAGKSTLFNALTGGSVVADNSLFTTLDTKTHIWKLHGKFGILLSDTVGFIKDIPHLLVASFHATLEEVRYADVIIHVVDSTAVNLEERIEVVNKVLEEIGASSPNQVLVFNKADASKNDGIDVAMMRNKHPRGILISAKTGEGLDVLIEAVKAAIMAKMKHAKLEVPVTDSRIIELVEDNCIILGKMLREEHFEYDVYYPPTIQKSISEYGDARC